MNWRRWLHRLKLLLLIPFFLLLLAPEWPAFADEEYQLRKVVAMREFDFLVWETGALLNKGEALLSGGQKYLTAAERRDFVLEYLELVREARRLEAEMSAVFSDPAVADPQLATRASQAALEETRQAIASRQLLAEAIVQEQVATVLAGEGFDILEEAWPPVLMHVSPLPSILIVSPRERIEKKYQVPLLPGLATPVHEQMETAVYDTIDLSALVVPIGGLGTFPSMIIETSDINRLVEIVSHEWVHHWLTLQPLGFNYAFDPDVRAINETVASIVDAEIGPQVIERYYPEYRIVPEPENPPPPQSDEPPAFDFATELSNTRVRVDELLAEGQVEEAEAYMEARRQEFVENGYLIRKLNQAFFAFYSAYAAEPGGAQGSDPIGPMLRDIRAHSPSIRAFLDTVAPVTSLAELQVVHRALIDASTGG